MVDITHNYDTPSTWLILHTTPTKKRFFKKREFHGVSIVYACVYGRQRDELPTVIIFRVRTQPGIKTKCADMVDRTAENGQTETCQDNGSKCKVKKKTNSSSSSRSSSNF